MIALGDRHIGSVAHLKGKRVGTAGIPYQSAYLKTILHRADVRPAAVTETNVGFNLVPAMLSKKVDATLGGYWNYEGIQLQQQHKNPTIIPVDKAGVPPYDELVFVGHAQGRAEGQPDPPLHARRDRRLRGAGSDPARGRRRRSSAANHDLQPKLQLASVKATRRFFPAGASRPFGYQDPRAVDGLRHWMLRNKLLTRPPNAADALTNEFLPGQGL